MTKHKLIPTTYTACKINLAKALAKFVHHGQTYGDFDYYDYHVLAVANNFTDPDTFIVALLHDVMEDSEIPESTITSLFGPIINNAIYLLTYDHTVSYEKYIQRIAESSNTAGQLAKQVKKADLEFHLSQPNAKKFPKYKTYLNALKLLSGSPVYVRSLVRLS